MNDNIACTCGGMKGREVRTYMHLKEGNDSLAPKSNVELFVADARSLIGSQWKCLLSFNAMILLRANLLLLNTITQKEVP